MTVPEVTENEIESPPVLIENQESYWDRNDQSISEHLESNYDPTVHSFYDEEVGVVTAENFFNSANPLYSDSVVCVDIEEGQEYFGAQDMFENDDKKELVPSGSPERCFISKALKKIKDKLLIHRFHILGIFLANLSGVIFTLNNCIIQWMKLDFSEIMLVRGSIQVLMFTSLLIANGYSVFPTIGENSTKIRLLVIFQGICGGLMVICSVSSVTFMPLGDAMVLIFTAPLSTMILAAIFLRHTVRLYRVVNALLLITGAILVIQPTFIFHHLPNLTLNYHDYYYYIGAAVALSSAVFDGFVNITINYCQEVQTLVLLWWAGIGAILCSFIGFAFDPNARMLSYEITEIPYSHWIAYVGITFQGMLGYFCMTKSLQMVDPTIVAFLRSIEIVFGYIFQVTIMEQIPTLVCITGAGLTLISILAMSLQVVVLPYIPEKIRFLF